MNANEYIAENTEWVDNCLLWTGPTKQTRGRTRYLARFNGANMSAARFVYFVVNGITFTESFSDYITATCGNRQCCNPAHLASVPKDEVLRAALWTNGESLLEYIRSHVSVSASGCWEWAGAVMHDGYGRGKFRGRSMRAHRIAFAGANGLTLDDMAASRGQVLHKCHNRLCCNPEHLYLGDHNQNMVDKAVSGNARGVSGGRPRLSPQQVEELKTAYAAGESMISLAARFGVTKTAISARLKDCKRPAIMTHRKLTDERVREVFSLAYAAGARPHAVCAEHGISLSSLRERARKLGLL